MKNEKDFVVNNISDAFAALSQIDDEEVIGMIKPRAKKLTEGKTFSLFGGLQGNLDDAKEYLDDAKEETEIEVIDVDADSVEHIKEKEDYIGQAILRCNRCKANRFIDLDKLVADQEDGELYNVEDECPHCKSTGAGFELIGQVGKVEEDEPEFENEDNEEDEVKFDLEEEEENPEEDEQDDESEDDLEELDFEEEPEDDGMETEESEDDELDLPSLGEEFERTIVEDNSEVSSAFTSTLKLNEDVNEYAKEAWMMNKVIMAMNDEEAYYGSWLYVWPDGETYEDCEYDFGDAESFEDLKDTFINVYKAYHAGGLYDADDEVFNYALSWDDKLNLRAISNIKPYSEEIEEDLNESDMLKSEVEEEAEKPLTVGDVFGLMIDAEKIEEGIMISGEVEYAGSFEDLPEDVFEMPVAAFDTAESNLVINASQIEDEERVLVGKLLMLYSNKETDKISVVDTETSEEVVSGQVEDVIRQCGSFVIDSIEKPEVINLVVGEVKEVEDAPVDESLFEQICRENNLASYNANKFNTKEYWLKESLDNAESLDEVYDTYCKSDSLKLKFKEEFNYTTFEDKVEAIKENLNTSSHLAVIYGYKNNNKPVLLDEMLYVDSELELNNLKESLSYKFNTEDVLVAYTTFTEAYVIKSEDAYYNSKQKELFRESVNATIFKSQDQARQALKEAKNLYKGTEFTISLLEGFNQEETDRYVAACEKLGLKTFGDIRKFREEHGNVNDLKLLQALEDEVAKMQEKVTEEVVEPEVQEVQEVQEERKTLDKYLEENNLNPFKVKADDLPKDLYIDEDDWDSMACLLQDDYVSTELHYENLPVTIYYLYSPATYWEPEEWADREVEIDYDYDYGDVDPEQVRDFVFEKAKDDNNITLGEVLQIFTDYGDQFDEEMCEYYEDFAIEAGGDWAQNNYEDDYDYDSYYESFNYIRASKEFTKGNYEKRYNRFVEGLNSGKFEQNGPEAQYVGRINDLKKIEEELNSEKTNKSMLNEEVTVQTVEAENKVETQIDEAITRDEYIARRKVTITPETQKLIDDSVAVVSHEIDTYENRRDFTFIPLTPSAVKSGQKEYELAEKTLLDTLAKEYPYLEFSIEDSRGGNKRVDWELKEEPKNEVKENLDKTNEDIQSFKTRKELAEAIQKCEADGIKYVVKRSIQEGYRFDLIKTQPLTEELPNEIVPQEEVIEVNDENVEVLDAPQESHETAVVPNDLSEEEITVLNKIGRIARDIKDAIEYNYNIEAREDLIVADIIRDIRLISGAIDVSELGDNPIDNATKALYQSYNEMYEFVDSIMSALTGQEFHTLPSQKLTQALGALDSPAFSTDTIFRGIGSDRFLAAAQQGAVPYLGTNELRQIGMNEELEESVEFDDTQFDQEINEYFAQAYSEPVVYITRNGSVDETGKIILEGVVSLEDVDKNITFTLEPIKNLNESLETPKDVAKVLGLIDYRVSNDLSDEIFEFSFTNDSNTNELFEITEERAKEILRKGLKEFEEVGFVDELVQACAEKEYYENKEKYFRRGIDICNIIFVIKPYLFDVLAEAEK